MSAPASLSNRLADLAERAGPTLVLVLIRCTHRYGSGSVRRSWASEAVDSRPAPANLLNWYARRRTIASRACRSPEPSRPAPA